MSPHQEKSRILKAFTDRDSGQGFDEAQDLLRQCLVVVALSEKEAGTHAGQSAALTAIATAMKCFGQAALLTDAAVPLFHPLPLGDTLHAAVEALGALVTDKLPSNATHIISIGYEPEGAEIFIRCWWDGWNTGVMPSWENAALGKSGNPLAGVYSGAAAVREVFASILGKPAGNRTRLVSLWEPWAESIEAADPGPDTVFIPDRLWFIGLGHLGQGYLWNLSFLPVMKGTAVIQDDQTVNEENVATGLLNKADDIGDLKTSVAAAWLKQLGWTPFRVERRHHGDLLAAKDDPGIIFAGLDNPESRKNVAGSGFSYMIDAGVGHGATDFEMMQLTVLEKGDDASQLWTEQEKPKDVDAVMKGKAYQEHEKKHGKCGTFSLAEASVAVPFVGAAVGAIAFSQAIRLGCLQQTVQVMQMDLAAPGLVIPGSFNECPKKNLGTVRVIFS